MRSFRKTEVLFFKHAGYFVQKYMYKITILKIPPCQYMETGNRKNVKGFINAVAVLTGKKTQISRKYQERYRQNEQHRITS